MSLPQNSSDIPDKKINQPVLRELIAKYFSLNELRVLCFNLNLDYEDLEGKNKAGKTMSLVLYFSRRNSLSRLIQKCREERPKVNWKEVEIQPEPSLDSLSRTDKPFVVNKLKELKYLLEESEATYRNQSQQRNRLFGLIHKNHEIPEYKGFNDLFFQLYDQLNREERMLFQIIRGTTERGIFQNNEKLQKWADDNPIFQFYLEPTPAVYQLEVDILQLKVHFDSWFPQYYNFFLNNPKESLVYLNDEYRLGIGFPKTLLQSVNKVISELES